MYFQFPLFALIVLSEPAKGFNEDYCGRKDLPAYIHPSDGKKVEKVHAFFRHGMRTDFQAHSCFPNHAMPAYQCSLRTEIGLRAESENRGPSLLVKKYKSGCEIGQLVDYAEVQMKRISKYLKQGYSHLLGSDSLYLRSTDKSRTLGSLDIVISNLWNEKRASVNTEEFDTDPLDLGYRKCQRVNDLNNQFPNSAGVRAITLDSEYFRSCQAMWVEEVGTEFNIGEAGDCLIAPQCANVPLPNELIPSKELYACVKNIYNSLRLLKYKQWKEGADFCPLATTPIWNELLDVSKQKTVSLWASHDDTIACMLSSMGVWDGVWPQYASLVIFEELSDGSVRVLRDGQVLLERKGGWTNLLPDIAFNREKYEKSCQKREEAGISPYANLLLRGLGVSALVNAVALR